MSQDCSVGLHNCSPPECHQEDKWICLKHSTSVDCISSSRLYQESDQNPYFAAIPWQYPASYWSGVFRGNRRNLQKLVVSNEVPKERACVQQFLYINASGTCSPAKKTDPLSVTDSPLQWGSTRRVEASERLNLWLHALFNFLSVQLGKWTVQHW